MINSICSPDAYYLWRLGCFTSNGTFSCVDTEGERCAQVTLEPEEAHLPDNWKTHD